MKIRLTVGFIFVIFVLDLVNSIEIINASSSFDDKGVSYQVPFYCCLELALFMEELGMQKGSKTKVCTKCNKRKKIHLFCKNKKYLGGYTTWCIGCCKDYSKFYREVNKGKIKERDREYRRKNKTKLRIKDIKYCKNNKDKIRKYHIEYNQRPGVKDHKLKLSRLYREENREKMNAYQREYRRKNLEKARKQGRECYYRYREKNLESSRRYKQNNKEVIAKRMRSYRSGKGKVICQAIEKKRYQKRRKDLTYKIRDSLGSRLRGILKGRSKSVSILELLGCSAVEFQRYFKNKFTKGMTWKKFMSGEIHIDHIKPCASFDLTKELEQRACFNFRNLQPLWESENCSKGAKYKGKNYSKRKVRKEKV